MRARREYRGRHVCLYRGRHGPRYHGTKLGLGAGRCEVGLERLKDPQVRARLKKEVAAGSEPGWSNLIEASGGWEHVVLANAFNPKYDQYRFKEH